MNESDPLLYPNRRLGLDHNWFGHRSLFKQKATRWRNGCGIALWVVVHLEFFPLDMKAQAVQPPGALIRPFPDFASFTNRDYGNRIGVYRIMQVLKDLGIRATVAANSDVAKRYPSLIEDCLALNWELMASGTNMRQIIHGDMPRELEERLIEESLHVLRGYAPVAGWHSPAFSTSMHTFELLARNGLKYASDWTNDEMPYEVRTLAGSLCSLPLSHELADSTLLIQRNQDVDDYCRQIESALSVLEVEARQQARMLSLSIRPWVLGQPHRIGALEQSLKMLVASEHIWPATGHEIVSAAAQEPCIAGV
jgi:allantoinase